MNFALFAQLTPINTTVFRKNITNGCWVYDGKDEKALKNGKYL